MSPNPPSMPPGASAAAGAAGGAASRAAQAAAAKALADQIGEAPPPPEAVEPAPFPPEAIKERCEAIVARYPTRQAALLPILHVAQKHFDNWISPEVEAGIARWLEVSDQHVRGVLTFYAMYHTEPAGRNEVWVCRTLSCWLRGAPALAKAAREKAGIEEDGGHGPRTSEDGRFTVMEMECLGLCEVAPAVFVNDHVEGDCTPERLAELMDECE